MADPIYRYSLRVDDGDGIRQALLAFLGSCGGSYLAVAEDSGENRHYHCYFEDRRKIGAVRKAVQRLGQIGNGGYSLKLCDSSYERYLQYMCKGESELLQPECVGKHGLLFTDEQLKEWHDRYWVDNDQIRANRLKRKKITSASVVEKLEEEAKNKGVAWSNRQLLAEIYINMQTEARKGISVHAARAVVNTVQVLLCPDDEAVRRLAEDVAYCK